MKISPFNHLRHLALLASILLATSPAHAAIAFYLGADGSGLTTESDGSGTATWSGGGDGYGTVTVGSTGTLIDNMTSGTLGGVVMSRDGTTFDLDFTLIAAGAGAVTADLTSTGLNGFAITDLQNVGGIRVVATYDEPLSSRMSGASSPRAWGFAVQNRNTDVNFDATLTFPDMVTLSNPVSTLDSPVQGTDFHLGTAPAGWFASPTDLAGTPAPMNTTSSTISLTGGTTPTLTTVGDPDFVDWLGIEGIDYDGNGNAYTPGATNDLDEALGRYTYLNTVDWLITSPSGAFTSTASFAFSMDGLQYTTGANPTLAAAIAARDNIVATVPEPFSTTLLGLGSLALMMRRRR